jgi:GrpB-like predicted nucleotidyltransferase (UPF0157 family)
MNATTQAEVVELTPYSPMWPVTFDIEKARLTEIFGTDSVLIEHVGSTAVPGLGAKPIIDILLGAPTLAVVERHIPQLVESGYRYVPEFEKAMPQRRYFVKPHGQPGSFALHAVVYDTWFWKDLIEFRDILRRDPMIAERYWRLKGLLQTRFRTDREAYNNGKSEFIRNALGRKPGQPAG